MNSSRAPSKWLVERTLKIFLDYYYPVDWIRDYLLDKRFHWFVECVSEHFSPLEENTDYDNDLLLCRKSLNIVSFARGLAAFTEILYQKDYISFESNKYCESARYRLYFHRKATGANHAGHHALSALWKELNRKDLNAWSAWLVYATVRCEESRIMGYEEDMMYWKEMKDGDDRTKRVTSYAKNILTISKDHEKKVNKEEWVKNYKYRSEQANLQGNKELAELWHRLAAHIKDKHYARSWEYYFMAAWSLTKAAKSDQAVPTIWKAVAHYFIKAAESHLYQGHREIIPQLIDLAVEAGKKIKKLDLRARKYLNKARKQESNVAASSYFEEKAAYLRKVMIIDNFDDAMIWEKIQDLKRYSKRINACQKEFLTMLRDLPDHSERVESLLSFPAKLIDSGFPASSKILVKYITKYDEEIERYCVTAELQDKQCWKIPSTENASKQVGLVSLPTIRSSLTNFVALLEIFISHLQQITLSIRSPDPGRIHPLDDRIKKFFAKYAPYVIAGKSSDFLHLSISEVLSDYQKAVEYGEKAQIGSEEGNCIDETAKLYQMMKSYRLSAAEWRAKNILHKSRRLGQAISTIQAAEGMITEIIQFGESEKATMAKAQKLHYTADVLSLRALDDQSDVRKKGDVKFLQIEAESESSSINTQLLDAVKLIEQRDQEQSVILAQRAALCLMLLHNGGNETEANRIQQLLAISTYPNLIDHLTRDYWKNLSVLLPSLKLEEAVLLSGSVKAVKAWNDRIKRAVKGLNQWKEQMFACSLEALQARLEGNEVKFIAWENVVKEINRGIETKRAEISSCEELNQTNWRYYRNKAKQIRIIIDALYKETVKLQHPDAF